MWSKILLYYHTLKYLKWVQIKYRLFYIVRSKWRRLNGFKYDFTPLVFPSATPLSLSKSIPTYFSFDGNNQFSFLSISHDFKKNIDWNYNAFGKLWTYNLNYFEFLLQEDISKDQGLYLIHHFIDQITKSIDGIEPFPTSLRIMSWVKFLVKHEIKDLKIDQSLYAQLKILADNLEYHLLGNHLLENGFALLFGAYYFKDDAIYARAKKILVPELEEQILADGAHFELSPMYHQLMLARALDSINLVKNSPTIFNRELLPLLESNAKMMLGWLKAITFNNGDIPLLNDSAFNIAPSSKSLFQYASALEIQSDKSHLNESGYRVFQSDFYKIVIDGGNIGPDYIPGHAHSDTLSFELHVGGLPFIIDTGISTYEKNPRRKLERSTSSHNTVMVGECEQSQVWGGFRVGKRARAKITDQTFNQLSVSHDGYKNLGVIHSRKFRFNSTGFSITDELHSKKKISGKAFLHFHPQIELQIKNNHIKTSKGTIKVQNANTITRQAFNYAPKFNVRVPSTKVIITFVENLELTINL